MLAVRPKNHSNRWYLYLERKKKSLKSTPFFWPKPFSTNHALHFICLAQSIFNLNKTCSLLSCFHSKTSPTQNYYSFKKLPSLCIAFFHFISMNFRFLITFKLPCICYHDKHSGWSTSLKVGTLLWIFHNLRLYKSLKRLFPLFNIFIFSCMISNHAILFMPLSPSSICSKRRN